MTKICGVVLEKRYVDNVGIRFLIYVRENNARHLLWAKADNDVSNYITTYDCIERQCKDEEIISASVKGNLIIDNIKVV